MTTPDLSLAPEVIEALQVARDAIALTEQLLLEVQTALAGLAAGAPLDRVGAARAAEQLNQGIHVSRQALGVFATRFGIGATDVPPRVM